MKDSIATWEDLRNYIISLENENEYLKQQLHKVLESMEMLEYTSDEEVNKDVRAMGEEKKGRR